MKQVKKNNKLLSMSTSIIPFLSQRNEQSKLSKMKKNYEQTKSGVIKISSNIQVQKKRNRATIYKLNTVPITSH